MHSNKHEQHNTTENRNRPLGTLGAGIRVREKRIPTLIELQVKLKIKNIVKKK